MEGAMTTAREQARETARQQAVKKQDWADPSVIDAVSDVWEPLLQECKDAFDSEDGPSEDLYRRVREALG